MKLSEVAYSLAFERSAKKMKESADF